MVKPVVICPDCGGDGRMLGMFPKYVEGKAGPPAIELDCDRCGGGGEIPAVMLEWMEVGKQCKLLRLAEDLGLRSGAVAYGMKPSELSKIENGKVDPTEHAQRLVVEGIR